MGFPAYVLPSRNCRWSLTEVLQLSGDPCCTARNACLYLSQTLAPWCFRFYCQVRVYANAQTRGFGTHQAE